MTSESGTVLKFSRITTNAFSPMKGSEKAAGYDLRRYIISKVYLSNKGFIKKIILMFKICEFFKIKNNTSYNLCKVFILGSIKR